jgi:hypothetical protein
MNAFSGGKCKCNVPSIVPCRLAVAVAVAAAVRGKSGTGLHCPALSLDDGAEATLDTPKPRVDN